MRRHLSLLDGHSVSVVVGVLHRKSSTTGSPPGVIVKYKDFQPLSIQTLNSRASGCRAWQSVFRQAPQVI